MWRHEQTLPEYENTLACHLPVWQLHWKSLEDPQLQLPPPKTCVCTAASVNSSPLITPLMITLACDRPGGSHLTAYGGRRSPHCSRDGHPSSMAALLCRIALLCIAALAMVRISEHKSENGWIYLRRNDKWVQDEVNTAQLIIFGNHENFFLNSHSFCLK